MTQKPLTRDEKIKLDKALNELYCQGGGRTMVEVVMGAKTDGSTTMADTEAGRKLKEAMAKLNQ